ncbi:MAG: ABC transporter permease [Geothrix sp.]|jgi:putative ABC transport system permease protein|uniref:ABC transporter permease n=1 Tax=Candidatus Geothrix odensensis TaxID=2954440 RepID=A0A936F4C3_9BACT|nr:ABC transporter permease [Holophagaceae bacterium]MBK8572882.1 ABC transporter permease [Candidatus Geothrix odensensis]MBP7617797.1 ABC transporter permease [Geothrix sp.]MCC6513283.1 ABC transporter permease [Geothrix sp.]
MNYQELFRVSLRAIRAHKLRSFLTLLGIIIGVTTIVGVVGIITGLNRYVQEKVIILAPDMYIVTRFGIIRSREEFLQAVKRPQLTWEEYQRLSSGVLSHASLTATRSFKTLPVSYGTHRLADTFVVGSTANFARILNLDTGGNGRFFTEGEDESAQNVAVIGADIKSELFPNQDPIGRMILVRGQPFRVIGHMMKEGKGLGINRDQLVVIPFQVYRKNFYAPNDPLDYFIKARGGVEGLSESIDETRAFLRALRHTSWRDPDPVGFLTQDQLQELWRQISTATFVLLTLIASVSLGVGGIVIMNIMLVSVAERTQEIGVRMALGARKRDIQRQFLLEASLLSMGGGVIGVLLGGGIALLVKAATGFPAQITVGIVLMGVGLSTVVGLLAGFLPARRAANLPVIDALRAE